jgi:hypothetical protein
VSLNPTAYTEKVVSDFLRYELTAYPFADPNLCARPEIHEQEAYLTQIREFCKRQLHDC